MRIIETSPLAYQLSYTFTPDCFLPVRKHGPVSLTLNFCEEV